MSAPAGSAVRCPVSRARRTRGALSALALLAHAAAAAQGSEAALDLVPLGLQVNQAIQGGATELSAGRSAFVRVPVHATGTIPPGALYDGLLRIYDDGVEIEGSPCYSGNGPLKPAFGVDLSWLDGTLNFVFVPPESNDVLLKVEVNPAGATQLAESSYGNNVLWSPPLAFHCKATAEIVFVPIDYRPFGGTIPHLPDFELIKPGVGDNFVQGIYPAGDWDYHRSEAPSKLWTSLLSDVFGGTQLAAQLAADMLLMEPVPDFIYGWVPGGLPGYNGVALSVPGVAAIGNTEPIRYQRTFAHELGHLFGLEHNSWVTGAVGIDVEHHLNLTEGCPQLQPATQKDIMYAGSLTNEAWISEPSYLFFQHNQAFACGEALSAASAAHPRLLLSGVHDRARPALFLSSVLALASAQTTPFVEPSRADLLVRVFQSGGQQAELGLSTRSSADVCQDGPSDADLRLTHGGFAALLPASLDPARIDRLQLVDAASGALLQELVRSASAPEGRILPLAPAAGGKLLLAWEATDADGDALRSYVRYSPDGVRRIPLATALQGSRLELDPERLPALRAQGFLEVLVSDGLRTTTLSYLPSAEEGAPLESSLNPPFVHVVTPDAGKAYPRGATVILHGSAWDLEDRALGGASLTWTSDRDGWIGVGRLTSTASLSVGKHVLTVQATDSDGLKSSDVTTITVADRPLPGEPLCQLNLGFGGPGGSVLSVCGGDLSTGTTAGVSLTGAAPFAPLFLLVAANPQPALLFGGIVIAFPPLFYVTAVTDAQGSFAQAVAGGGGPFLALLQAVSFDPGVPQGVGLSNAVGVAFLP